LYGDVPSITPEADAKDNVFTYLVTPRFKVSPNLMVYARLASGYRPGGANSGAATFGFPLQYSPDKTQNYEIGAKGDFLDHTFSVDASLYYIDWHDIQLGLYTPDGFSYTGNGKGAKSQGVELSVESRPLSGLTIAGWVALNDAHLTENFPIAIPGVSTYGISGDRLPYSSRFSGSLSLEQSLLITNSVTGFVGGAVSYVGGREGEFTSSPERQHFSAYAKTDLRAGMRYEDWAVNLYVNNVADKRAILNNGGGSLPFDFQVIQPRTMGLSIVKRF
jgi:outer membrane receptor protein involved in Fe transport